MQITNRPETVSRPTDAIIVGAPGVTIRCHAAVTSLILTRALAISGPGAPTWPPSGDIIAYYSALAGAAPVLAGASAPTHAACWGFLPLPTKSKFAGATSSSRRRHTRTWAAMQLGFARSKQHTRVCQIHRPIHHRQLMMLLTDLLRRQARRRIADNRPEWRRLVGPCTWQHQGSEPRRWKFCCPSALYSILFLGTARCVAALYATEPICVIAARALSLTAIFVGLRVCFRAESRRQLCRCSMLARPSPSPPFIESSMQNWPSCGAIYSSRTLWTRSRARLGGGNACGPGGPPRRSKYSGWQSNADTSLASSGTSGGT